MVNILLSALPEELRRDLVSGRTKAAYERKSVEFWNKVDPSEAIRSDLIVPTLERHFEVVERIDYGGNILHRLLEHIIHNFDNDNPHHLMILDLLVKFEDILIERGVMSSDFVVMALAQKREGKPRNPQCRSLDQKGTTPCRRKPDPLRAELASAYAYIAKIEASRGWRLLERLRAMAGRRWRR